MTPVFDAWTLRCTNCEEEQPAHMGRRCTTCNSVQTRPVHAREIRLDEHRWTTTRKKAVTV